MNCCTNSFPLQRSLARLTFLIAAVALPALGVYAQTRSGAEPYQKIAFKTTKPCVVPTSGEVTALVKSGVELSVTEDWDCDGIPDAYDNCVGMPNRDQTDSDHDGIGDVCEAAVTINAGVPTKTRSNTKATALPKTRANKKEKNRSNIKAKSRKAKAAEKHSRSTARSRRRR